MEAICNNPSCKFARNHKIFQVGSMSDSCPSCGSSSLLPGIATKYKSPKEHCSNEIIANTKAKLHSVKTNSRNSNQSSTKVKNCEKSIGSKSNNDKLNNDKTSNSSSFSNKSLESIELSYKDKLQRLSKAIKNDKTMKKFSKIDDDILSSDITLKELKNELKKIDSLFDEFNVKVSPKHKDSKNSNQLDSSKK